MRIKLKPLIIISAAILIVSFGTKKREYAAVVNNNIDSIPAVLLGDFTDDYGIRYSISDSLWVQHPGTRYHILKWNTRDKFLIARNDNGNKSEPGLYTRIDYVSFTNMDPFKWGFCLSVYNAKSDSLAETTYQADKENPRKGCNGFPFSRMKKN